MTYTSPPTPSWRQRLRDEWLLVLSGVLAVALAVFDPRSVSDYQRWLQWPTLAGLTGLLIATQGIRDSALVQRAATLLTARAHSLRSLGLMLVAAAALLSMLLTNDVSLFLIVPLTLAIGSVSNLPVLRMVVLEAFAVNAGSTLSPIGNPQNLLLWQHSGLSFLEFVTAMLPTAAIMLLMVATLTAWWLPCEPITANPQPIANPPVSRALGIASIAALGAVVMAMEYGQAPLAAGLLLALFALLGRQTLRRVDWLLLLTFAAIFLALGHLADLPKVKQALALLDFSQPLTLYLSGIIGSQLISNVPATVLLLERTTDVMALAIAVNVGGFGMAIGSLANLIALRLARRPQAVRVLHAASLPFLLVCAPLVYAVWRWLA